MKADEPDYTHWAFICCSQQDRQWAGLLADGLARIEIPESQVGRPLGGTLRVPERFEPIFLEPDDKGDAEALGDKLVESLFLSRYLLIICSPQTARSQWCNDAARFFKYIGRSDRILNLVVDGEPNSADPDTVGLDEALPLAVRRLVDAEGKVTEDPDEPRLLDLRKQVEDLPGSARKTLDELFGLGLVEGGAAAAPAAASGKEADEPAARIDLPSKKAKKDHKDGKEKPARKKRERVPKERSSRSASGSGRTITVMAVLMALLFGGLSGFLFYRYLGASNEREELAKRIEDLTTEAESASRKVEMAQAETRKAQEAKRQIEKRLHRPKELDTRSRQILEKALGTTDAMVRTLTTSRRLEEAAIKPIRDKLLGQASGFYDYFLESFRSEKALAPLLEQVRRQKAELLSASGSHAEASGAIAGSIDRDEARLRKDPENDEVLLSLAQNEFLQGSNFVKMGKHQEALAQLTKAERRVRALYTKQATDALADRLDEIYVAMEEAYEGLGKEKERLGVLAKREPLMNRALSASNASPESLERAADYFHLMSEIAVENNAARLTRASLEKVIEARKKLARGGEPAAQQNLIAALYRLARFDEKTGKLEQASDGYATVVASLDKLRGDSIKAGKEGKAARDILWNLAQTQGRLAETEFNRKRYTEALDALDDGREHLRDLAMQDPSNLLYVEAIGVFSRKTAEALDKLGRDRESREALKESRQYYQALVKSRPVHTEYRDKLVELDEERLSRLVKAKAYKEAEKVGHDLDRQLKRLIEARPRETKYRLRRASMLDALGGVQEALARKDMAVDTYRQAEVERTTLVREGYPRSDLSEDSKRTQAAIERLEKALRNERRVASGERDVGKAKPTVSRPTPRDTDVRGSATGRVLGMLPGVRGIDMSLRSNAGAIVRVNLPERYIAGFEQRFGKDLAQLNGKDVAVSGRIDTSTGRSVIILSKAEDLRVIGPLADSLEEPSLEKATTVASKPEPKPMTRSTPLPKARTTRTSPPVASKPVAKPEPKPRPKPEPVVAQPVVTQPEPRATRQPPVATTSAPPTTSRPAATVPAAASRTEPHRVVEAPPKRSALPKSTPVAIAEHREVVPITRMSELRELAGHRVTVEGRVRRAQIYQGTQLLIHFWGSKAALLIPDQQVKDALDANADGDFIRTVYGKILRIDGVDTMSGQRPLIVLDADSRIQFLQ